MCWMHDVQQRLRLAAPLLILLAGCLNPHAAGLSLTDRSPFLPQGFTPPGEGAGPAAATPAAAQALEFRGMYKLDDAFYFLVSSKNQVGKWLPLGNSGEEMAVQEYDADNQKILVSYNGQSLWLELADVAAVTGQPVAAAPTPATQPAASAGQRGITPTRRTVTRPPSTVRPTPSAVARNRTLPQLPNLPRRSYSGQPPPGLPAQGPVPTAPSTRPATPPPNFTPGQPPAEDPAMTPFN